MLNFLDPYRRRLRTATVGSWPLDLVEALDILREVLDRRRLRYTDAGGGRSRWWQVHLLVIAEPQVSFVLYRRPWSGTCLAVDDFPDSAEPLVDAIVTHFEETVRRAMQSTDAVAPATSINE